MTIQVGIPEVVAKQAEVVAGNLKDQAAVVISREAQAKLAIELAAEEARKKKGFVLV